MIGQEGKFANEKDDKNTDSKLQYMYMRISERTRLLILCSFSSIFVFNSHKYHNNVFTASNLKL